MNPILHVCGRGAVSPGGFGLATLEKKPLQEEIALLSQPEKKVPCYRVDLKDAIWSGWQKEPRLRRASSLAHFMAEAAHQALAECPEAQGSRMGLVAALGTGSIIYSRRFFADYRKQGKRLASPALFPETVYNSPTSHLAALLGLNGAVYSLVGDESAWVQAIKTARLWLKLKQVDYVLVIGAEELDAAAVEAYSVAGWLRGSFRPAEGATALLLSLERQKSFFQITEAKTGPTYRSRHEALAAAKILSQVWLPTDSIYLTAQNNWLNQVEIQAGEKLSAITPNSHLGEAFTASAGWHTLLAATHLKPGQPILVPHWGLNHQVSWLRLVHHSDNV